MPQFKAFGMINLQSEIKVFKKILNPQMTKTSQDNNG
jgi:hypothetical protein